MIGMIGMIGTQSCGAAAHGVGPAHDPERVDEGLRGAGAKGGEGGGRHDREVRRRGGGAWGGGEAAGRPGSVGGLQRPEWNPTQHIGF